MKTLKTPNRRERSGSFKTLTVLASNLTKAARPMADPVVLSKSSANRTSISAQHDKEYRIVLNVGGVKHVTYKHTLKKIPATRLSRLTRNSAHYDYENDEYFFDRHPTVFTHVLNYYRTGKLHYPMDVCGPLFEEELNYWGLDGNQAESCCWLTYTKYQDTNEVMTKLEDDDNDEQAVMTEGEIYRRFGFEDDYLNDQLNAWQVIKPQLWAVFDKPQSGKCAKVMGILSIFFLCLALSSFCLQTHSVFRVDIQQQQQQQQQPITANNTTVIELESTNQHQAHTTASHPVLVACEMIANCWFAFEIIMRLMSCPSLRQYFLSPYNIIDIIATVAFFIDFWIKTRDPGNRDLEWICMIRLVRLARLTQHSSGLKVLAHTFRASARELALLIFFLLLGIVVFASLVYYAERTARNPDNAFISIPDGIWWALVTMTTVGRIRVSAASSSHNSSFQCAGVLTIAMPVPVIVSNFEMYYTHTQARQRMPKKKLLDTSIINRKYTRAVPACY